ncbi:MAG: TIGR04282 family arsenosugar biosynthesis glycosyltransferase [Telmatospirillum sp.]|nr:TIGR04282 family arsenosugar biosynthesis glycosyltransferase [Telmatospirillum sp.]
MKRTLIVFAKFPQIGRVKTRLAKGLGAAAALAFYRRTLAATLAKMRGGPWQTVLCVSPDAARRVSRVWPSGVPRVGQGRGDLGQRMARSLASSKSSAVIVGGDIPEMESGDIATAFAALGAADIVVGPAADGGYWLVGVRSARFARHLFDRVRWSSEYALADTLANAKRARVAKLRTLADIDTAEDWRGWQRRAKG